MYTRFWRSVLKGTDLLKKCIIWHVVDGESSEWPWLPEDQYKGSAKVLLDGGRHKSDRPHVAISMVHVNAKCLHKND